MRNIYAGLAGAAFLCLLTPARADYVGDYAVGTDNICTIANTYQPSTGAVFALASAAVDVYKDDSDTQDNDSGLTISAFDSLTGTYMVCVDTSSDGTFYSAGSMFHVLVSVGTVDSVSVVGSELMTFSLAKGPLAAGAITATVIATDAIGAAEIASAAIAADEIATDAIGAAEIAADAVGASEIAASAITNSELASDGSEFTAIDLPNQTMDITGTLSTVTTVGTVNALGNDAIAAADIADGAIDEATFATTAGSFKPLGILDQGTAQAYTAGTPSLTLRAASAFGDDALAGAVVMICGSTQGYCQSTTIASNTLADDIAVLAGALSIEATGTVTYYVFGTPQTGASLGEVTLADGGITAAKFASGAITATVIAADAIGASELATDAIGAAEIASAAIAADEIAADAIGASEIAASAITNSELASDGSEFTAIDLPNQTMDITGTLSTVTTVTSVSALGNDAIAAADVADDVSTEIARKILDTAVDGTLDVEEMLCYLTAVLVNDSDYDDVSEAEFFAEDGTTPLVTVTYTGSDRSTVLAACGN